MSATGNSRVVPLSYPTNQQFLQDHYEDAWGDVLVTSIARDPSDRTTPGGWPAWRAADVLNEPHFDAGNTYYCPSLLRVQPRYGPQERHLRHVIGLQVLTFDDIGATGKPTLADLKNLLETGPSYVLETSPGNFQVGFKSELLTDLAWVKGMLYALDLKLGGRADNLTNLVAWRRLPVGRNTKAALVTRGWPQGWPHRLNGWRPDRIIRGLDWLDKDRVGDIVPMPMIERGIGDGQRPDAAVLAADAVYQALVAGGMVISEKLTSDKYWAVIIRCPWIAEHGPDRPEDGCVYVPRTPEHPGWFKCFHCERKGRRYPDYVRQLDTALREAGGRIVAAFEFDEVLPEAGEVESPAGRALASYEATEDGVTQAFAGRHSKQLRFDHVRQRWYRWAEAFWRQDETQHAFRWACDLAREFRGSLQDAGPGQIRTIGKVSFAAAIEREARSHRLLAVDGLGWDCDPWLIGAPGCEIDLRTGATLPPDPGHMITRQLLIAPANMPTPLWDRFLWDSTGGDAEMIRFLQAWSGYCLTGDTSEEKFVFFYGPGGNGKGTFLFTISTIMNDYAARTPAETFMVRKHDSHPNEIARLAGTRAVIASEIEEGRVFNVGRLKDFTGRDGKLMGRFMRQEWFEFTPQFKLMFVGNNQPRITNVDDAMQRRTNLLPFLQTPKVADITLKDRLVAEYPGILRWMIEGENLRRTMGGLTALVPAAATVATQEYLGDQDTLKAWAAERCVFGPQDQMGVTAAFEDYKSWCFGRGDSCAVSLREFSRKFLEAHPDCQKVHNRQGWFLVGVSFSPQDDGL